MHTRRFGLGGAFAAIGFAVLLSACGGGGGGDQVASASGESASRSNGDDTDKPSKAETEEAFRKFAQCMRERGIDVPDPQFDEEGGPVIFGGPDQGGEQGPGDPQKFEQADKECRHHLKDVVNQSGPKLDPEEKKKMEQQALDFAKCMREHGIDLPDPKFDDGGVQITLGGVDSNDPKLQEAHEVCAKESGMPKPGEKGPGRVQGRAR
jgi:hypothetical protein